MNMQSIIRARIYDMYSYVNLTNSICARFKWIIMIQVQSCRDKTTVLLIKNVV